MLMLLLVVGAKLVLHPRCDSALQAPASAVIPPLPCCWAAAAEGLNAESNFRCNALLLSTARLQAGEAEGRREPSMCHVGVAA